MVGAVEELLKKRAELTERHQTLEQQIKQIDSDVAAIDQAARLFDPSIPRRSHQEVDRTTGKFAFVSSRDH